MHAEGDDEKQPAASETAAPLADTAALPASGGALALDELKNAGSFENARTDTNPAAATEASTRPAGYARRPFAEALSALLGPRAKQAPAFAATDLPPAPLTVVLAQDHRLALTWLSGSNMKQDATVFVDFSSDPQGERTSNLEMPKLPAFVVAEVQAAGAAGSIIINLGEWSLRTQYVDKMRLDQLALRLRETNRQVVLIAMPDQAIRRAAGAGGVSLVTAPEGRILQAMVEAFGLTSRVGDRHKVVQDLVDTEKWSGSDLSDVIDCALDDEGEYEDRLREALEGQSADTGLRRVFTEKVISFSPAYAMTFFCGAYFPRIGERAFRLLTNEVVPLLPRPRAPREGVEPEPDRIDDFVRGQCGLSVRSPPGKPAFVLFRRDSVREEFERLFRTQATNAFAMIYDALLAARPLRFADADLAEALARLVADRLMAEGLVGSPVMERQLQAFVLPAPNEAPAPAAIRRIFLNRVASQLSKAAVGGASRWVVDGQGAVVRMLVAPSTQEGANVPASQLNAATNSGASVLTSALSYRDGVGRGRAIWPMMSMPHRADRLTRLLQALSGLDRENLTAPGALGALGAFAQLIVDDDRQTDPLGDAGFRLVNALAMPLLRTGPAPTETSGPAIDALAILVGDERTDCAWALMQALATPAWTRAMDQSWQFAFSWSVALSDDLPIGATPEDVLTRINKHRDDAGLWRMNDAAAVLRLLSGKLTAPGAVALQDMWSSAVLGLETPIEFRQRLLWIDESDMRSKDLSALLATFDVSVNTLLETPTLLALARICGSDGFDRANLLRRLADEPRSKACISRVVARVDAARGVVDRARNAAGRLSGNDRKVAMEGTGLWRQSLSSLRELLRSPPV